VGRPHPAVPRHAAIASRAARRLIRSGCGTVEGEGGNSSHHSTHQGGAMSAENSAENEAVVRRFYEQMCNERKNELAGELFTDDHVMHDPQVPAGTGPQ